MRVRRCLWTLFGGAQLVIVVCGACQWLPANTKNPLARAFQWYATVSGANSQYGFYAPEVGDHCRPRFLLHDEQGSTWPDSFERANTPEARLRLEGSAEAAFANGAAQESPARRERLVKSWAAAMFTRHPSALSLTVVVEAYDVPTMAGYRAGARPSWKTVYEAQVQRNISQKRIGKRCRSTSQSFSPGNTSGHCSPALPQAASCLPRSPPGPRNGESFAFGEIVI